MAVLSFDASFNAKRLVELAKRFPELGGKFLSWVGTQAREHLKHRYLSGQELTLNVYPLDSRGRHTIVDNVTKNTTLTIYSYPLNLFEKGRKLRNGRREKGKKIITVKLKRDVLSNMNNYINVFENGILKGELDKRGL